MMTAINWETVTRELEAGNIIAVVGPPPWRLYCNRYLDVALVSDSCEYCGGKKVVQSFFKERDQVDCPSCNGQGVRYLQTMSIDGYIVKPLSDEWLKELRASYKVKGLSVEDKMKVSIFSRLVKEFGGNENA